MFQSRDSTKHHSIEEALIDMIIGLIQIIVLCMGMYITYNHKFHIKCIEPYNTLPDYFNLQVKPTAFKRLASLFVLVVGVIGTHQLLLNPEFIKLIPIQLPVQQLRPVI